MHGVELASSSLVFRGLNSATCTNFSEERGQELSSKAEMRKLLLMAVVRDGGKVAGDGSDHGI